MSDRRRTSHGRRCECGAGRGFRTVDHAMHVYHQSTKHLGLTTAPGFYVCAHGKHHWETKETTHASA